jgi:hypothetical protein
MVAAVAQRHVQHRAVFGVVDLLAGEHALAPVRHIGFLGQLQQQAHGLIGDAVLRVVQQQLAHLQRKPLEPPRIRREQVAHAHTGHDGLMRFQ